MHPLDRLRESRLLPALVVLGALVVFFVVGKVAGILAPFLWAMVTAYVLFPLVSRVERALRLPRIVVVGALYIVFIAVVTLVIVQIGPLAVSEARSLADTAPELVQNARAELINDPVVHVGGVEIDTEELNRQIDEIAIDLGRELSGRAVPLLLHTVEFALHTLVYLLVTFYLLLHGDAILRQARSLAPRRYRTTINRVGRQVNATLGAYIRGQVILFFIMATTTYIALTILDVEYALLLAIATGALELVPILGPWVAGAAAVTVALSQGHAPWGWTQVELGVAVGLTYFVLRMLEDHFVIPQLIGRIVRVHPVLVIFAILAGAHIFGMLGLLLAVPAMATLKIVLQAVYFELGNPPPRRVLAIKSSQDLALVREALSGAIKGQIVLLLGPSSLTWDDLPALQELAMLAVGGDVQLRVVSADPFAASLATAAGLPVVTQAVLSDEVGTAETLIAERQEARQRRRFAFRAVDAPVAEAPAASAQPLGAETAGND